MRGLTLAQLAEMIHKGQSTVSKYETGDIAVDVETLYDISDALHIHAEQKWALFNGFSSRPMMPIAIKMLLSRERLPENEELLRKLKVSREDIRLLKLYNMLSAT